jgi:pilus assembly protein CpaB
VVTLTDVIGKIAAVSIEPQEQILWAKLTTKETGSSGLAVSIPDGKRAFTIEVTDITGVAGNIMPGDSVVNTEQWWVVVSRPT